MVKTNLGRLVPRVLAPAFPTFVTIISWYWPK
jgi:hypothetical protein